MTEQAAGQPCDLLWAGGCTRPLLEVFSCQTSLGKHWPPILDVMGLIFCDHAFCLMI